MQKLTIIYPFYPIGKKAGGVETFMKGIIKYLPDNIAISIVGLINEEGILPLNSWSNINFEGKEIPFYPVMIEENEDKRELIPLSIRFTLALKRSSLDLSGHDLFFHRLEPAVLFLNNRHRKYFVFHNDIEKFLSRKDSEVFWAKVPWLYKIFERIVYRYASKVLTVNGKTLSYYHKRYKQNKEDYAFIPTWVDTEIFYPLNDEKELLKKQVGENLSIPSDNKWLLFVGRLQKQKAPEKLIEVISELSENQQLVLVGDGNLRDDLESLAEKLNVRNRVHFLGTMKQDTIRSLFQVSDLFLLTSNFEGMPICVLEAQACGLPVVSTPVGEVARIVTDGRSGIIAEDHSVKTLAEAVSNVLVNNDNYAPAHCINAVSDYTAPKVIESMFKFYYGA